MEPKIFDTQQETALDLLRRAEKIVYHHWTVLGVGGVDGTLRAGDDSADWWLDIFTPFEAHEDDEVTEHEIQAVWDGGNINTLCGNHIILVPHANVDYDAMTEIITRWCQSTLGRTDVTFE